MDAMMNQRALLHRIQELQFATVDIGLYLDNYPENQKALNEYNCFTQELMKLKRAYEMNYGPLTHFGYAPSAYPWKWINEPWPWEM